MSAKHSTPPQRGDESELFVALQYRLEQIVRAVVITSAANVQDACAFAWVQLLRRQPDREHVLMWLATTAIRQAIKLDRRDWRVARFEETELGFYPRYEVEDLELHAQALEALSEVARLEPRPRRLLALQVAGYTYEEIARITGDSVRTVDRQLRRAHAQVRHSRRSES
jgi:DNA-directed RNA polymerase specialized sigma24 family protein